ncbi:MAG: arginine--tRNA ligase [Thermomicrobiales bacterium]
MLEQEELYAADAIAGALREMGYALPAKMPPLRRIPLQGQWGVASSVALQLAKGDKAKAAEIAEGIAERLRALNHFADVRAENGYVNCIFDTDKVATALVQNVLSAGAEYGRGAPIDERVMIEYAQMNTHKEFHVGHLRNVALGAALVRIMRFAGYDVVAASYPGDIGLHVIKCLWCYREFHMGKEPKDPAQRGRWLGELYVEGNQRLAFRKEVGEFIERLARDDQAFIMQIDGILKNLVHEGVGSDVANLMAVLQSHKPFDPAAFKNSQTVPQLWAHIGDELRSEKRRDAIKHEADGLHSDILAELWKTYQQLDIRFNQWWLPSLTWEAEVRALFQAWDRKDPAFVALWEKTRQWSLDQLHAIFAQLGAPIDVYFFESEVEESGRAIVKDLLERGIAEVSDGLPVVKIDEKLGLEKETYRTLPILRSDGTTLYATKDLALAAVKFDQYHVARSIYVVDSSQSFYFQQIFKVLELMGFPQAAECRHLPYERLTLPGGAMSSRSGSAIFFEDVAADAVQRARAAVEEKNPDLPEEKKAAVAEAIGIGALLYGMLDRDNNKVLVFDWEQALSFDGHAAPYIQYAHARACRILERAQAEGIARPDSCATLHLADPATEELNLLEQIGNFPAEVRRAAETDKPLIISTYVYELAKFFSDFYGACPVMQADGETRTARLALVDATRQTLANALALLGIHAPDVM